MQTTPIKQPVPAPQAPVNGNTAHKHAELVSLQSMPLEPELLSLAVFGMGGVGKTRLLCSMPGDVGVIPLNSKCKRTVQAVVPELCPDKKFWFPKDDLIRHANPMALAMMVPNCKDDPRAFKAVPLGINPPACCAQHYYIWHVNRIKDAVWTMVENPAIKSIAIDDGTQLYEDMLYSHYGRAMRFSKEKVAYGPPNNDMIDLINSIKYRKHLLIIHQAKDEYRGDVNTGKDTVSGFKSVGFHVSTVVEMSRDLKSGEFYLSVRQCQDNAALYGQEGERLLQGDEIDFAHLAAKVFGEDKFIEYLQQCM